MVPIWMSGANQNGSDPCGFDPTPLSINRHSDGNAIANHPMWTGSRTIRTDALKCNRALGLKYEVRPATPAARTYHEADSKGLRPSLVYD